MLQELTEKEMSKVMKVFSKEKEIIDSLGQGDFSIESYIMVECSNELVYLSSETDIVVKLVDELESKKFFGLIKKYKKIKKVMQFHTIVREITESSFIDKMLECKKGKYANTIVSRNYHPKEINYFNLF